MNEITNDEAMREGALEGEEGEEGEDEQEESASPLEEKLIRLEERLAFFEDVFMRNIAQTLERAAESARAQATLRRLVLAWTQSGGQLYAAEGTLYSDGSLHINTPAFPGGQQLSSVQELDVHVKAEHPRNMCRVLLLDE